MSIAWSRPCSRRSPIEPARVSRRRVVGHTIHAWWFLEGAPFREQRQQLSVGVRLRVSGRCGGGNQQCSNQHGGRGGLQGHEGLPGSVRSDGITRFKDSQPGAPARGRSPSAAQPGPPSRLYSPLYCSDAREDRCRRSSSAADPGSGEFGARSKRNVHARHRARHLHACVSCHRPGGPGPFSLATYEDVRRRAQQIAQVTRSRFMPPWKVEPDIGPFRRAAAA